MADFSLPDLQAMEPTIKSERQRPVAQDALRLLTVVHLLGEQEVEHPAAADEGRWFIDTESRLLHLDHLVRHPIDLAYLLMDQVEARRDELDAELAELAAGARRLLATPRQPRRRPALLRPFEPASWLRWDDPLAYLGCLDLLRVEPLAGCDLRFRLTARGAAWLEHTVYPAAAESFAPIRARCELLRAILPAALLRSGDGARLAAYLRQTHQRLDAYRLDERIQLEEDMLARLFQATFLEPL